MRSFVLAAVAAVAMGSAAEAAVVTYTYSVELTETDRRTKGYSFANDEIQFFDIPVEFTPTTRTDSFSIGFDTDRFDPAGKSIRMLMVAFFANDRDWPDYITMAPLATDEVRWVIMSFDDRGRVDSFEIERTLLIGPKASDAFSGQTFASGGSNAFENTLIQSAAEWNTAMFGPRFDFVDGRAYHGQRFASSGPGTWTIDGVAQPAPVPLPASAALLLTGGAALLALRRRQG